VHHGNGTHDIFLKDKRVIFWSSFQHPFYPGTDLSEIREGLVLSPLAPRSKSEAFRKAVERDLIPLLEETKPECIFFSAGFDAHVQDPLANLALQNEDYEYITQEVVKIAKKYAKDRIISVLEGGYHLSLGEAVVSHLKALL
jgi:acetoin utilization deacetylase AcuC-like enzyme